MIGKTGETAPIRGDGRARWCGAGATRRAKKQIAIAGRVALNHFLRAFVSFPQKFLF